MSSHERDIYDRLIQAADPLPGSYSDQQIEDALRDLRVRLDRAGMNESAGAGRWRWASRSRVRLVLAMGVIAAAASFVLVNALPRSNTAVGVSPAWAGQVIARATVAATGGGAGILHLVETTNMRSSLPGGVNATTAADSWMQQTRPYSYWSISGNLTTVVVGHRLEYYNADSNLLYEGRKRAGVAPAWYDHGYRDALSVLQTPDRTSALPGRPPRTFAGLISRILRSPGLTVDRGVCVDGIAAIRIEQHFSSPRHPGVGGTFTLYVRAGSYTPLEFVTTDPVVAGGTGRTGTHRQRWELIWTTRFRTYESLPAGSVAPPDLRQLHPGATITHRLSEAVLSIGKRYVHGHTSRITQTQTTTSPSIQRKS